MAVGDEDPNSPTVKVHEYLRSQGLQPTAQNVHNVLMAQSMGMPVMKNLVTEAPPGDDVGVGQRGNVASKVEGGGKRLPEHPIPPDNVPPASGSSGSGGGGGNQNTSAAPSGGLNVTLGEQILGGAGAAAGLGAGGYAGMQAYRQLMGGNPTGVPSTGADGMPLPDIDVSLAPKPQGQIGTDQYRLAGPDASVNPMEAAMQRALAPPGAPQIEGPPNLSGINPPVQPSDVMPKPALPPGVTPQDAANIALRGQPTGPMANMPIAPPAGGPSPVPAPGGGGDIPTQIIRPSPAQIRSLAPPPVRPPARLWVPR